MASPAGGVESGLAVGIVAVLEGGDLVEGKGSRVPNPAQPPSGGTFGGRGADLFAVKDGPGPGAHFVLVSAGDDSAAIVERARSLCPGSRFCQVYGWSEASAIPSELPLSNEARRQLRFSYLAPRNGNPEAVFFDCRLFAQPATGRCLPAARP